MGCRNVCKPPVIFEHVQEAYPRKSDIRQTQIEISTMHNSRERLSRGLVKNITQNNYQMKRSRKKAFDKITYMMPKFLYLSEYDSRRRPHYN